MSNKPIWPFEWAETELGRKVVKPRDKRYILIGCGATEEKLDRKYDEILIATDTVELLFSGDRIFHNGRELDLEAMIKQPAPSNRAGPVARSCPQCGGTCGWSLTVCPHCGAGGRPDD